MQKAVLMPARRRFGCRPSEGIRTVKEEALLLTSGDVSSENGHIAKVLRFFGVPWRELTKAAFLAGAATAHEIPPKFRLFCSSDTFLSLITDMERGLAGVQFWKNVHSAFVYAGDDSGVLQELAAKLAGNRAVTVQKLKSHDGDFVVSDELDGFCGVMTGVRIAASKAGVDGSLFINAPKEKAINIISVGGGATFLKLECHGAPVFLSTCSEIVDLDAELATGIFDIRDHLLSALPVVLHVKWAFARTCWNAAETNACLVIDDPVLKPAYGFVNFHELLSLMKRHGFSTNIAFIPWNWKRSSPEVARLFRENPKEYSLSVHGCDHTRGEFGSHDRQHLYWKTRQGMERMARHELRTEIHHDPVMVFPQGVFSEAAMSALRHTGLIGAVNNDTISADPHPRAIRISDVWDIAVMGYSNFPLFTRRYPWEGIENFAFDILLGKPCIVIIHHDFCQNGYQRLIKFIDRVNALKCPLSWRSLGDVVRRSCRQRELSPDTVEVEMYGTELRVGNRSGQPGRFLIGRRESDPSAIKEVSAGARPIEWKFSEDRITFEVELTAGQSQTVAVTFHDLSENGRSSEHVSYKVRTMLRRYLSEVRDNYVMKYQKRWRMDGKGLRTEDRRRMTEDRV
jgi:hypothetical protein